MFINWPQIQRELEQIGERGKKVSSRVLNTGIRAVVSTAAKEVSSVYNISQGDVRKAFSGPSRFASSSQAVGTQTAFAIALGKRIPAYKFGGQPAGFSGAVQASVEIIKGQRKLIKGKFGHGGFTATVHGGERTNKAKRLSNPDDQGHTSIWEREGSGRNPLREASGPDVPALIEAGKVRPKIDAELTFRMKKEFVRQCRFVLGMK